MNLLIDSDHLSCSAMCPCYLILRVFFYRLLRSNNFALNPSFFWIKVLSVAS